MPGVALNVDGGLREAVLGFRVCFLGLGLGFRVLVVRFWVLRFLA